ncbi:hypothetical protein LPTSP2_33960 [Leptospira ellinghausenii]|uniref:Uncharacterized protein n=1 Tax=Leptospira ellinghausenii TaxID=1917822 RepID=A0A2P2DHI1_9LEPT|nr:hypothetical protein [Leptospira ellinghausenii]GBF44093.1 hypothetical protein LPTSP2_33960 [Leptospira ellinghausenii]
MRRILYAMAVFLRMDKLHKAMLDAVIETRVKNALQTSDKLRKEQDRLREKEFRKQMEDLQNNHNSSFENYKLETENLIRIFKNQILVEKKEVLKEREVVKEMQRQAMIRENRFQHYILRFKEILFVNKKVVESIQSLVKVESNIEDLLYEIDNYDESKFIKKPEMILDTEFLNELHKKEEEIRDNILKFQKKVENS